MQNFLIGGVSGMCATCIIQPVDFIKVQIQVRSEMGGKNLSPFKIFQEIKAQHGMRAFYKGLDSALLRQLLYTSTRLGIFYSIKDKIVKTTGKNPTMLQNVCASLTAGIIGSFCGNPADLALVRMQSDNNLPVEERRNYKNVFDALMRIVREEGVTALWRGSGPTVVRAIAMNFSLLMPFEEAKKFLTPYIESTRNRAIVASMISGVCASTLSLPFDNIKTKLQKMKAGPNGELPYKGIMDCAMKTANKEGFLKLWVGLNTYYVRIAPHVVITLLINELLRSIFLKKN